MDQPPHKGSPDFLLLALTFILVGFGIVMVFSASSAIAAYKWDDNMYLTRKQMMFAAIGIFAMFTAMNVHYSRLKKWFIPFAFVIVAMLVIVLFRESVKGAHSWFMIGSFGIQPAEFAKLAIILYLAAVISKKGERIRQFKKGLLPVLISVSLVGGLILIQPDFGTFVIFTGCAAIVIIAGGTSFRHLFWIGGLLAAASAVVLTVIYLVKGGFGFRGGRISSYLDPWSSPLDEGFQLIQSLFAFGHGGLTGAGFGQSIEKLHYLPEAYNDFIFAIIGEELGFIGSAIFLIVYLAFLWRGILVAVRCPDLFGTLAGIGIVGMFGIQSIINIGGVTGALPITGVTLPFISYGGSSLLASLLSVGILLNISRGSPRVQSQG